MINMAQIDVELMSIGQVANATGGATTALRDYEREGVLKPTLRSQAGYRLYGRPALEQLEFIRAAQAAGFTLDDGRVLVEFDGGHGRRRKRGGGRGVRRKWRKKPKGRPKGDG